MDSTRDKWFKQFENPTKSVFLLRLTWVEANVDLKDRSAEVLEGRLQENKDVGDFRDNSWKRSAA